MQATFIRPTILSFVFQLIPNYFNLPILHENFLDDEFGHDSFHVRTELLGTGERQMAQSADESLQIGIVVFERLFDGGEDGLQHRLFHTFVNVGERANGKLGGWDGEEWDRKA